MHTVGSVVEFLGCGVQRKYRFFQLDETRIEVGQYSWRRQYFIVQQALSRSAYLASVETSDVSCSSSVQARHAQH